MSGLNTRYSGETWHPFTARKTQGLRLGVILAIAGLVWGMVAVAVHADPVCPPRLAATPGKDLHGQTLIHRNFAYQNLENADFSGASLIGVNFIGANLTGASFRNAIFGEVDGGSLKLSQIHTGQDAGGNLYAVGIGTDQTVYWNWQSAAGQWSGWKRWDGAPKLATVTTGISPNGVLNVLGLDPEGNYYITWLSAPAAWTQWYQGWSWDSHPKLASITTRRDASGNLYVYGMGLDHIQRVNVFPRGSSWSGWREDTGHVPKPEPVNAGGSDFTLADLTNACFIGAQFKAPMYLTQADLTCADFSQTNFLSAIFDGDSPVIRAQGNCRTKFNGTTLDIHTIPTSEWGKTDFSHADFQGVSPDTFSLKGNDISGAMLAGSKFINIDMTGANLTSVDLTSANLTNAKMDNAAMNGATLVKATLPYATLTCARFYGNKADNQDNPNGKACPTTPDSRDAHKAADMTQANLEHVDLSNATLNFATLHGTNLSGATLKNTSFISATLEPSGTISPASLLGADLTGAHFSNAHLNHVQFNNVILTGAAFDRTTLNGTNFSGSIMPNASFEHATLEDVNFHDTILQAANFANATMKTTPEGGGAGVTFTCSQLGGANFKDAMITAANFQAAVMPPETACCKQKVGDPWCGTIDLTQQAYGPMTYPVLNADITCPDGEVARCSKSQWEIPQWKTDLCSPDRSTQTVWTSPDCGAAPGDIVHFKDENLKQCILAALPGKHADVTVSTAGQIRAIDCPGRGIKDLDGLETFTGLVTLDLTGNQLTQFGLRLHKLKTLKIDDNQLNMLDLSGLQSLIRLTASNNQLKSIVGMESVYLSLMDVSHNQFTDIDLPVQTSLVYADLSSNRLTNVLDLYNHDLRALTSLLYLDLSYNSLTTIGSIKSIAKQSDHDNGPLESLFLTCNPAFDCHSLGLDGKYPALQDSQCAELNPQNSQWIVLAHPQCLDTQ